MARKPRVYLLDAIDSPLCAEAGLESGILGGQADLVLVQMAHEDQIPPDVSDADALIVSHFPQVSSGMLRSFKNLRMIVRNGVGFDNIDVDAARELGIPVCNVPDYGTEEVADQAILLTLALERNLYRALNEVRGGVWTWRVAEPGRRVRGQRFGIIGCGRIGTATALRAKAFGFRVQFYDPYLSSGYEKAIGVERCSALADLLRSSDVVSLHCPLNSSTRGMLGLAELELMKPGAFLVNTARGPLIPEADLLQVLRSGLLGGVALDVLDREPACSPELFTFANCLITPHIAFYSAQAVEEMRGNAARNVLQCLSGKNPINVVNGVRARHA